MTPVELSGHPQAAGRRKLVLVLGSSLALLLALGAGTWGFLSYDPAPALRLRDRSAVSVQAVWVDRPPRVVMGPRWMQALYPVVPSVLRERWDWRTGYTGLPPGTGPGISIMHRSPDPRRVDAALEDGHGCVFAPTASNPDQYGSEHLLSEHRFALAPRDGRFRLRFSEDASDETLTRESLPLSFSAAPAPSTALTTEALPSRRSDGGCSATLHSVAIGPPPIPYGRPGNSGISFQVEVTGEWRPFYVTLTDGAGASHGQRCSFTGSGPYRVWAPVSVCRERAYRLRVEFSRVLTSGATPDLKTVPPEPPEVFQPRAEARFILFGNVERARIGWRYRVYSRTPPTGFELADEAYPGDRPYYSLTLPPPHRTARVVVEGFKSRFLEWTVRPDGPHAVPDRPPSPVD